MLMLKENPEKFVPPIGAKSLPEVLPRRITEEEIKEKFPQQFELGGYCTVTYVTGKNRFTDSIFLKFFDFLHLHFLIFKDMKL